MSLSILITTPQLSFGEHIRQILEEKYPSHVIVVGDVLGALSAFEKQNFTHAFLDTDLRNGTVLELGLALREIDPGVLLTLMSADPSPPPYEAIEPWTLLRKPFYLPDLLRIVDDDREMSVDLPVADFDFPDPDMVDPKDQKADQPLPDNSINWLEDVSKAAQHLTSLTLESSAQAALIIRQRSLWAYSGQLSQPAAAELVRVVSNDKKTGDLLKFIRLDTTQAEHMLYATELADGINLAMVFDAETPFSTIRSQATHLADSLSLSPPSRPAPAVPDAEVKAVELDPEAIAFQKEHDELKSLFDFGDDIPAGLPLITQILENVPSPNPVSAASESKTSVPLSTPTGERSMTDEPMPHPFERTRPSTPANYPVNTTRESSPAMHIGDIEEANVVVEETRPNISQPREDVGLPSTRVSKAISRPATPMQFNDADLAATRASKPAPRPQTPMRVSEVDLAATRVSKSAPRPDEIDLAATRVSKPEQSKSEELAPARAHSITEVAGRVLAEPSSAGLYDLTYACLLLPRFNSHHLTGDLADRLSTWMPNVSVAFGWRLEYISVRPDYLQWVINVPPTASPGYLMRIIRKQTSERIFDEFPRLKRENPSGDFWAPGYLIMGGSQPHPSKLVKDYIQRTRERQGMP